MLGITKQKNIEEIIKAQECSQHFKSDINIDINKKRIAVWRSAFVGEGVGLGGLSPPGWFHPPWGRPRRGARASVMKLL